MFASLSVLVSISWHFLQVSIWYGCVLRGDLNNIRVAAFSNIQDKTVVHAARQVADHDTSTPLKAYHVPKSCSV